MKSETSSASSQEPLPPREQDTLLGSRMLTPLEIEQLRQDKREAADFGQKRFAYLREKYPSK